MGQLFSVTSTGGTSYPKNGYSALEALPGWSWDPVADSWIDHYNALKAFAAKRRTRPRPAAARRERVCGSGNG